MTDPLTDAAALLHDMGLGCRRDYRGDADCGGAKWHEDTARLFASRWNHRATGASPLAPAEGLRKAAQAYIDAVDADMHRPGTPADAERRDDTLADLRAALEGADR